MDTRGALIARLAPGPFHCLSCRAFVTGTPSGHCPKCGFVPPVAPEVPEAPPPARRVTLWLAILALCALIIALAR